MGQATVDLPVPIDLPQVDQVSPAPVSAAALASADDLLSQLAGEDIDRLLAEAEVAAQAPFIAKRPEAEPLPSVEGITPTAVAEKIEPTVVAPSAEKVDAATAVAIEEAEALQAMIEPTATPELIAPLPDFKPIDAHPADALLPSAASPESIAAAPTITPPAALIEDATLAPPTEPSASFETSAAEVAALFAPTSESEALGAAESARSPSLIVRLLQVINSPLSWISDTVRDALGKAALLTLFNAVAVLVYVLVFRRHGK